MQRLTKWVALALAAGLAGAAIGAADEKDEKKSADIQVWAIRATTKNKDVSPELKDIADALKKQFKFTGFKLEKKATGKADIGKPFSTPLIGAYRANVTPKKNDGKRVELQVEVLKDKDRKLNTAFTIDAGKTQPLGGWDLDGEDALIVAVSAR